MINQGQGVVCADEDGGGESLMCILHTPEAHTYVMYVHEAEVIHQSGPQWTHSRTDPMYQDGSFHGYIALLDSALASIEC